MSVSQLTPRPRSLEDCCMDRLALLRSVPFFATSSEASLRRAAGRSSWQHFGKGGFLFHAGEQVDRIFVIASGQVAATITSKRGTPLVFHVATTGECPGHTDLLHDGPHTASAQALDAVTALAVPARTWTELLEAEPAALLAYAKDLAAAIVRVDRSPIWCFSTRQAPATAGCSATTRFARRCGASTAIFRRSR